MPLKVLLVEDTVPLARAYEAYLANENYIVQHVETGQEALDVIASDPPDAILLDLVLPDMNGLSILEHVSEQKLSIAVIVITANASLSTAVEAMRLGALDYLVKPFNADRLKVTLSNALERQKLSIIVDTYRNDIDRHEYNGFIGSSLPMQRVYRIIDSAASSKATVFITGESGTGKEVCAEAIHHESPRAAGPFVALNCGAIPKDLMESEIFGHVKGSFTGAVSDHVGAASRAHGGTLFLDEICEMDSSLQTKLLRFVQTNSFQKVGAEKPETVDIRFVCATNKDPQGEVDAGRFREDLLYRLLVIPLHMPRLFDRGNDVLAIGQHLLDVYAQEEGKLFKSFDEDVVNLFTAYAWPGNVRQLQNIIRNVVVLNDGEIVTSAMLPAPLGQEAVPSGGLDQDPQKGAQNHASKLLPDNLKDLRPLNIMEQEIIEHAIELCSDNVPKAAAYLGVSASTIYRKQKNWAKDLGSNALS